MFPFKKRPDKAAKSTMRKLVAGLIIGGAIGSILGKKGMDEVEEEKGGDDDELE